jgi:hypothetical protein
LDIGRSMVCRPEDQIPVKPIRALCGKLKAVRARVFERLQSAVISLIHLAVSDPFG